MIRPNTPTMADIIDNHKKRDAAGHLSRQNAKAAAKACIESSHASLKEPHKDLMDLIIYSRKNGVTIDKFSAEHISKLAMKNGCLIIESTQRSGRVEYIADLIGFYFQAR